VVFFRFYWLVFREAFRHSLDIAQSVIFFVVILSGLVAARNPSLKPMIDRFDLGGWQIAVIVLGAIVLIRLVFAPYWLWRAVNARIAVNPEKAIDWGLRSVGFHFAVDKKKKALQVQFILENGLDVPLRYEVEDILVTIEDKGVDSPTFDNMGGVVSRMNRTTFAYPWIFGVPMKGGSQGTASITFKYGIAGSSFVRTARYVHKLYSPGQSGARSHPLEESENDI
jgi:hypothetical protein